MNRPLTPAEQRYYAGMAQAQPTDEQIMAQANAARAVVKPDPVGELLAARWKAEEARKAAAPLGRVKLFFSKLFTSVSRLLAA